MKGNTVLSCLARRSPSHNAASFLLSSVPRRSFLQHPTTTSTIHSSTPIHAAAELSFLQPSRHYSSTKKGNGGYTPEQLKSLREMYSPEQLSGIMAGEESIDPNDFAQRKHRSGGDPFKLPYLADLSTVDPFLDFPANNVMPGYHPQQPVPKTDTVQFTLQDESTRLAELAKATGFDVDYLSKLKCRQVLAHRISNQTRLGKINKLYYLTIAGDGNGMIGIGEGKGMAVEDARSQSLYQALKNLTLIPRYEERTIYGDVKVKFGAVELRLMARPPGYGARVSQYIFDVCRFAGIHDISARLTRSRNPMNVIKATVLALQSQRLPESIARGRGKKIVDVRKVYYGGQTL